MSKKRSQWYIVIGFVSDEPGYLDRDADEMKAAAYYVNTAGKAAVEFSREFGAVHLEYCIECGSNEPEIVPFIYSEKDMPISGDAILVNTPADFRAKYPEAEA